MCSPGTRARLGALGVGRVRMSRAVESSLGHSLSRWLEQQSGGSLLISFLVQRAVSEGPRWTRAVGDHLASPQGRRLIEERCIFRLEKTPDPFSGSLS